VKIQKAYVPRDIRAKPCMICDSITCANWWTCYRKYLRSVEWQEIRYNVFERDNYTCVDCGYNYKYIVMRGIECDSPDFPNCHDECHSMKTYLLECSHQHDSYKAFFTTKSIKYLRTRCRSCHKEYDEKILILTINGTKIPIIWKSIGALTMFAM
jgi:hypothetical protein